MSFAILSRYLTPWKFRRERERLRVQALKERDGEDCRRCRRPMRFDLADGHDLGPKIEPIVSGPGGEPESVDHLCLTHRRCHSAAADHTRDVMERVRLKNEAELFAKSRKRRSRAA